MYKLLYQYQENPFNQLQVLGDGSTEHPLYGETNRRVQLALAIMQSQIQMMEGGYGHPDGGENRPGVGDDAKVKWDRFEFKSVASLRQRGSYGSVSEQKEAAANGGDAKHGCEEEPTCSICLCEYEKGDMLVSLPCKHVFHEACITSWTDHNTRCPLCNADLQSVPGEAEMV